MRGLTPAAAVRRLAWFVRPHNAMRKPLLLGLLASTLTGCATIPLPVVSYLPNDFASRSEGSYCPGRLTARLFDQDYVTLDVAIQPGNKFWGSLRLGGPSRFLDSQMTVSSSGLWTSVTVELNGCVRRGQAGSGNDCTFDTGIDAQEVLVSIPAFEVEGSRRELPPIRFSKRDTRSWCWLSIADLARQ